MRLRARSILACALALPASSLAACGEDEKPGTPEGTKTLTVYASLPLSGPSERQSRDMVDAMKLRLSEARGRVGPLTVNVVPLDSSETDDGQWTNEKVLDNAKVAVKDPNAIAYIGDLDSAATALTLPLLNEAGILQVSPSSTYTGLTRKADGRKGEPERFYPSEQRTFGRPVPPDSVQARALVSWMEAEGRKRLYLLDDRDIAGYGLTVAVQRLAEAAGIEIVAHDDVDGDGEDGGFAERARKVAESGADAFLYGGSTRSNLARMYRDVGAAAPRVALYGGDRMTEGVVRDALPSSVQRRVRITAPLLPDRLLPRSAARFTRTFRARFRRTPEPYAVFAYEAMGVTLQAIADAGERGNRRAAVVEAFFAIRDRRSPLGSYSVTPSGDTSLRSYAGYHVRDGRLAFVRTFGARPER